MELGICEDLINIGMDMIINVFAGLTIQSAWTLVKIWIPFNNSRTSSQLETVKSKSNLELWSLIHLLSLLQVMQVLDKLH